MNMNRSCDDLQTPNNTTKLNTWVMHCSPPTSPEGHSLLRTALHHFGEVQHACAFNAKEH